jgi:hypothetical protein
VLLLGQEDEAEAFEGRTCDKKESVNSKCEKRFGKRNREIMREGFDEGSCWTRAEGAGEGHWGSRIGQIVGWGVVRVGGWG